MGPFYEGDDDTLVGLETEENRRSAFFKVPLIHLMDKKLVELATRAGEMAIKVHRVLKKVDEKIASYPFAKKHLLIRAEEKPKFQIFLNKNTVDATIKASLEDQVRLKVTDEDIERGLRRSIYINERKRELEQKQKDTFNKQKRAAFAESVQAEARAVDEGRDSSTPS